MASILVVEDDFDLAQTVELYLRREGHRSERASDGLRALELFRALRPDLVILDIGLPKLDGLEVLRRIRQDGDTPVILLTARAEEVDELLGLGLGADDYLVKPASARVLLARVKAVLKRSRSAPKPDLVRLGALEVDSYRMEVRFGPIVLELTPSEFRLLHHLALMPGRATGRDELLAAALPESEALERAVDIHMTNLRRKLRAAGAPEMIETVRGLGYRLREAGSEPQPERENP